MNCVSDFYDQVSTYEEVTETYFTSYNLTEKVDITTFTL